MSVQQQTPVNRYVGNGVATVYSTNYKALAKADVIVAIDGSLKTVDVDFAVTGLNQDTGFSVTFVTAPASLANVVIYRSTRRQRLTDYQQSGDFLTPTVNPDFDNAILQIQELQEQSSRALTLPITDSPAGIAGAALGTVDNRKGKYLFFNAITGAIEYAVSLVATALSQSIIAQLLNPQTPGEAAAVVTIVNYWRPVGDVDRYGTNSVPGTTDMTAAFNAAYQVAKQTGCDVQWGFSGVYRCNSPINCTQMRGIVSWDRSSKNQSTNSPSIIFAHTGHGFDASASTEMTWNYACVTNLTGIVPKSAWFFARNAAGSGAGIHSLHKCRTVFGSRFSNVVYSYGSEENDYYVCSFYNHENGSNVFSHNRDNPAGYTSTFLTISSATNLSNACHRHIGCSYFNFGNSGAHNEVVFDLRSADNFTFRDGLWFCENGLAMLRVGGTAATGFLTLDSIRGEPSSGLKASFGIDVTSTGTTGVNSHIYWTINNVRVDSSAEMIRFAATAEIQNLAIRASSSSSGFMLLFHTMRSSVIEHLTNVVTMLTAGVAASNTFIGTRSQVLLAAGTDSLNTGFDQALGRYWESGDSFTAPSTACTGAITPAVIWSLTKFNRKVTVALPSISATATAATNFAFGSALPAAYRPAVDLRIPIIIRDNGGTPNQQGMVIVTAATGAMTVFKDILATGNFTAAVGAGLPGVTEISWTIA